MHANLFWRFQREIDATNRQIDQRVYESAILVNARTLHRPAKVPLTNFLRKFMEL